MRAIVRRAACNAARSVALVCLAAIFARADAHDDVIDVVTSMAAALTEVSGTTNAVRGGNVPKFMSAFSKETVRYWPIPGQENTVSVTTAPSSNPA